MSLYGVMRTGVSGMAAQSNKLSTVADNIANVNTTGYKRASTEFSSLILRSGIRQLQFRRRRDARPLRDHRSRTHAVHDVERPTSPSRATASSSCPTPSGAAF